MVHVNVLRGFDMLELFLQSLEFDKLAGGTCLHALASIYDCADSKLILWVLVCFMLPAMHLLMCTGIQLVDLV